MPVNKQAHNLARIDLCEKLLIEYRYLFCYELKVLREMRGYIIRHPSYPMPRYYNQKLKLYTQMYGAKKQSDLQKLDNQNKEKINYITVQQNLQNI